MWTPRRFFIFAVVITLLLLLAEPIRATVRSLG